MEAVKILGIFTGKDNALKGNKIFKALIEAKEMLELDEDFPAFVRRKKEEIQGLEGKIERLKKRVGETEAILNSMPLPEKYVRPGCEKPERFLNEPDERYFERVSSARALYIQACEDKEAQYEKDCQKYKIDRWEYERAVSNGYDSIADMERQIKERTDIINPEIAKRLVSDLKKQIKKIEDEVLSYGR